MGVMADSLGAYMQPLIDQTDGSANEMQKALSIGQFCWNLALLPEEEREKMMLDIQTHLQMDEDRFCEFRRSIIAPMIQRHYEMFPRMPRMGSTHFKEQTPTPQITPPTPALTRKYPGTGRNEPCPCNSGRKYKRCCGR